MTRLATREEKQDLTHRADRRVVALARELTVLAEELGPHARLPTTRELCQRFQVSSVTLRTALDDLEARDVVQRRPRSGLYVSEKLHHKRYAVLVGPPVYKNPGRSPFWNELLTLCVEATDRRSQARAEDYTLHLINQTEPLPSNHPILQQARDGEIEGILALGVNLPGGAAGVYDIVPVVHFASGGPWNVSIDHGKIDTLGAEALIAQGCQRIALWKPANSFLRALREPFQRTLEAAGLHYDAALMQEVSGIANDSENASALSVQEQGYQTALRVFGGDSPWTPDARPDGIVITDDLMTTGVLAALRELEMNVGTDVRIATHSNVGSILLFGYEKSLTVIEVDPAEIIVALFDLLDRLQGDNRPGPCNVYVAPRQRQ